MRFRREAQALAALNHPSIATIYGLEESKERTALVLELVEGETLADRLRAGAIPWSDALPIAIQNAISFSSISAGQPQPLSKKPSKGSRIVDAQRISGILSRHAMASGLACPEAAAVKVLSACSLEDLKRS